jgi:hypothetical protein
MTRDTLPHWFMARVAVQPNGCWHWTGSITSKGYGRFTKNGRELAAHRVAYEIANGEIAQGLTVDHVCHNLDQDCNLDNACRHRRCVNPSHLEAVPARVNILRGRAPTARRSRSSACEAGHELTGDNLYIRGDGHRMCRTCNRLSTKRRARSPKRVESNRAYRQRNKEAIAAKRADPAVRERQRAYSRASYLRRKAAAAAQGGEA